MKAHERKLVWENEEALYESFFLFFLSATLVLCPELSASTMRCDEERTGHSGNKEVTEVTPQRAKTT